MVKEPAGFWVRLGGNLLDGIIVGIPLSLLSYMITGDNQGDLSTNILSLLYAIFLPVYWNGYVIGKRIVGIRIVKIDGAPVGIGTMLLRTIVAGLIYVITFGVGLFISAIMVAIREDKRAIHDFVAGTYVTKLKPGEE